MSSASSTYAENPDVDGDGVGVIRCVCRMVHGMDASSLVGRDRELGSLEVFLDEMEAGPAALVLGGEAGIGKTVLWDAGVVAAAQRLDRVLTCRGVEAEASLSFAGLSELLAGVLGETLGSLVTVRRRALEVALLLVEPGENPPDVHAVGLAVLNVLQVLAEQGPVVVAVDDLQWLDPASAGVLQVALRRLRAEPVGLLATVRESPDASGSIGLERCFAEARPVPVVGWSGQCGSAVPHAPAATDARSVAPGAGPPARGDGWQPVLRARARTRADAVREADRSWPAVAGAPVSWASCSGYAWIVFRWRPARCCSAWRWRPGRRSS
jgi:AAA ATPase domain